MSREQRMPGRKQGRQTGVWPGPGVLLLSLLLVSPLLVPRSVQAQRVYEHILVLPPVTAGLDSQLIGDLHAALRTGTRVFPSQRLLDTVVTRERLGSRPVRRILSSRTELREFAESSGARFVIGSIFNGSPSGQVEVSLLLYSISEDEIREVQYGDWAAAEAASGTRELARELTHPRYYSPSDTPFFYSLFVPGLGQFQQGAYAHAAVSSGLVLGALIYQSLIPRPDNFRLDWENYHVQRIADTNEYLYMIGSRVYPEEEFYEILSEARRHNIRAERERREAKISRRQASHLLVGAYIFNLLDTLVLTRRRIDTRSFFLNLEALPGPGTGGTGLQLRLRIPLGAGRERAAQSPGIRPGRGTEPATGSGELLLPGFPLPVRPPADPAGR